VPVVVWHGEEDRMVPPAPALHLVRSIPASELRLAPGEGDVSLFGNHMEEVLAAV
jgi:pimeloyl-ACP methyl ester carboxylesterase